MILIICIDLYSDFCIIHFYFALLDLNEFNNLHWSDYLDFCITHLYFAFLDLKVFLFLHWSVFRFLQYRFFLCISWINWVCLALICIRVYAFSIHTSPFLKKMFFALICIQIFAVSILTLPFLLTVFFYFCIDLYSDFCNTNLYFV